GTNTSLPWGMWSSEIARYINANQAEFSARGISVTAGSILEKGYVHPTFLYESLWCLLSFGILYLICKKWRRFSGQLMLCYGVLYGTERFFVEGMRLDSLYIGATNLRVSQLVSAVLALGCLAALILLLLRDKKDHKPIEGIDFFPEDDSEKNKKKQGEANEAVDADTGEEINAEDSN
ncbi:MAG: prolipoprotein diacylglyceryl transferase, partial [Oscillospiraceae bacterium]|nr:prolipoprotein diacylglyceryl transferase [Oscillospiraceae bacterium]